MDEPTLKKKIKSIAGTMQSKLNVDVIDAKTHGELIGLSNELDRLGEDLSDSNVKSAIRSIGIMLAGGVTGYSIGLAMDKVGVLLSTL